MLLSVRQEHGRHPHWAMDCPLRGCFTPIAVALRERLPGYPGRVYLLGTTEDRKFVRFFPCGATLRGKIDVKLPREAVRYLERWEGWKKNGGSEPKGISINLPPRPILEALEKSDG